MVFWAVASRTYSARQLGESAALISAMMLLSVISQLNLAMGISRLLPQVRHHRWRGVVAAYGATAGSRPGHDDRLRRRRPPALARLRVPRPRAPPRGGPGRRRGSLERLRPPGRGAHLRPLGCRCTGRERALRDAEDRVDGLAGPQLRRPRHLRRLAAGHGRDAGTRQRSHLRKGAASGDRGPDSQHDYDDDISRQEGHGAPHRRPGPRRPLPCPRLRRRPPQPWLHLDAPAPRRRRPGRGRQRLLLHRVRHRRGGTGHRPEHVHVTVGRRRPRRVGTGLADQVERRPLRQVRDPRYRRGRRRREPVAAAVRIARTSIEA